LEFEVRFVDKKVLPRIDPKTMLGKKHVIELSESILNVLEVDEIKAICLHEIGHLVGGRLKARFACFLITSMPVAIVIYFSLVLFGFSDPWRTLLAFLVSIYIGCYSVRWSEFKADEYAKKLIGKEPIIRALKKVRTWVNAQEEFKSWRNKLFWRLLPLHPSYRSRISFLERDC